MVRAAHVLAAGVALALLGFGRAQPAGPPDPLEALAASLQREAAVRLGGQVRETVLFPPRAQPDRTVGEMPPPPPFGLELVRRNFRASLEPGEAVAGRPTWRLELEPHNPAAPHFRVWLDRAWGVRLAFEEVDAGGMVTRRAHFERVNGLPTKRAQPRQLTRVAARPALEARTLDALKGLALPEGFRVVSVSRRLVGGAARPALEVGASNGLSPLVVVVAPSGQRPAEKLALRQVGAAWLWVVGNLPAEALEAVAANVTSPLRLPALLDRLAPQPDLAAEPER